MDILNKLYLLLLMKISKEFNYLNLIKININIYIVIYDTLQINIW